MRSLLLILTFFYVHITISQSTLSQGIDQLLNDIPTDGPGVAIGVYQDGELLISKTKGLANIGLQTPITTASNFNLASVSKQFTAACIIHLNQENRLKLSDPISTYLPMLKGDLKSVTIQQLLNHASGIRDYMALLMVKQSDQVDFFNSFIGEERHLYDLMSKQRNLEFEPGTEHRYSNTNYWLLGQIVSASSGMSLGEYAQKYIFEPLHMDHTEYQENSGRIIENRAMGHVLECLECEIFEYNHRTTSVGAGGLLSNIDDLLKWENEFYNHEVLNADSWKLMTTPATLKNGKKIDYACGLILGKHKGYDIIQHSGQDPGFVNMILKFPDQKLSIAVLGNFTWYDEIGITFGIADLILDDIQPIAANITPAVPEAIKLSKSALEKFCGTYFYNETNEIRSIKLENDTLVYVRNNGPSSVLIPVSDNKLIYADRPETSMTFTFGANGQNDIQWNHYTHYQTASSLTPLNLSTHELSSYVGIYFNEELEKSFEIILNDGSLFLSLGQQKMPLSPTTKDKFVGFGMFKCRFERDHNGSIASMRLDAPRAGNILCHKTELVE